MKNGLRILVSLAVIVVAAVLVWLVTDWRQTRAFQNKLRIELSGAITAKNKAEREATRLSKARARDASQLVSLASDLAESGKSKSAFRALELALGADPENKEALLLKGRMHAIEGDYGEAVAALERHEAIAPKVSARALLEACRSARASGGVPAVVAVVAALRRDGMPELARRAERAGVVAVLGDGSIDPRYGLSALDTWSPDILAKAMGDLAGSDVATSLSACLGRIARCDWRRGAADLRRLIETSPKETLLRNDVLVTLLFAADIAAETLIPDIEALFTARKTRFDPSSGTLSLRWEGGEPRAWEVARPMTDRGGALFLAAGELLPFLPPFRLEGEEGPTFRARLITLTSGSALALSWIGDPTLGSIPESTFVLKATGERAGWFAIAPEFKGADAIPEAMRQALPSRFFGDWKTLEATVRGKSARLRIPQYIDQSAQIDESGRQRLVLTADGGRVLIEWFELSGPIDGFWLATQIALREQERAASFYETWRAP